MKPPYLYNKVIVFILISASVIFSRCISTCKSESTYCASKYPVLLVHGIAFRDKTFFIKYWGKIPESLKRKGAVVFTGGQEAYGTIENNALSLKKKVDEILADTGAEKVNIIAHSRGGLEARYMISMAGMENKVASLTTLSTPHRGSAMADYIIKHAGNKKVFTAIIDFYAKVIGDDNPESLNAGRELTTDSMMKFNDKVKDSPHVYYQSYTSVIGENFGNPLWKAMYKLVANKEGPNDGLVSATSAKWGAFRGLVTCNGKQLVTHADIVGMHFLSGETCFNADQFMAEIVHELKDKGY
jgi:triacylglycerol lipase